MNRALLSCCALLVGCGGTGGTTRVADVSLQIQLVTYPNDPGFSSAKPRTTASFSLTCAPTGGTLPFAARICDDIARHPTPMLDPYRSDFRCGGPFVRGPVETVLVTGTVAGKTAGFEFRIEPPKCLGPGLTAARIFVAAANSDGKPLSRLERGLQCYEDFFPTTKGLFGSNVEACMAGLYTPRIERLIRIAKRAPAFASFGAARLFPPRVGAAVCEIPRVGTGSPELCRVSIADPWARPTISFELKWITKSGVAHHFWHVALADERVVSVTQTGPRPPRRR